MRFRFILTSFSSSSGTAFASHMHVISALSDWSRSVRQRTDSSSDAGLPGADSASPPKEVSTSPAVVRAALDLLRPVEPDGGIVLQRVRYWWSVSVVVVATSVLWLTMIVVGCAAFAVCRDLVITSMDTDTLASVGGRIVRSKIGWSATGAVATVYAAVRLIRRR